MVDEATDVCGRSVCGALIGAFNQMEKSVLFDLVKLSETNKKTIFQLVVSVTVRVNGPEDFTNLRFLLLTSQLI